MTVVNGLGATGYGCSFGHGSKISVDRISVLALDTRRTPFAAARAGP